MRLGLAAVCGGLLLASCMGAPPAASPAAWLGVAPPPGLTDPPVRPAGSVTAAVVPAGEEGFAELRGARIRPDVLKTISFAEAMRDEGAQMWGRIAGFRSEAATADWVAEEFRRAGLKDVAVQTYAASGEFWWPERWEVRALADPAYGARSQDVVLRSAVPVSRSAIAGGTLEAEVVFTGEAGAVSTEGVAGKIAVQHTRPATGAYSDRAKVRDSAAALIKAGAVAVINWVEQAGNMHVYDFGGCGGPCFNIGGDDGRFLSAAVAAAKAKGAGVRLRLSLTAGVKTGLSAKNVIGTVPGASDEIVVVNAHLDSWFAGAGDNADGVAVMLALARHFAKPENKPARTLLFVGSGGHHSTGMNGPGALVAANGALLSRAVLVVNLEHLAQFQIDAVPEWRANAGEQPKNFGVSNAAPWMADLVRRTAQRYGFAILPEVTNSVPGDLGGYAPLNVSRIQGIHSGPLYHTSGDVAASISDAGLEKAARFYAHLIAEAARADRKLINP